jgi:hypothetical protein
LAFSHQAELPHLKQAFDRKLDETAYQRLVQDGPHLNAVREISAKKEAARKEFEVLMRALI